MLNEFRVLSVVNDDSSELVKRDQSLEVASEKSMLNESENVSPTLPRFSAIKSFAIATRLPKADNVSLCPSLNSEDLCAFAVVGLEIALACNDGFSV